ncbi:hypothetical protein WJX73_005763 [Symbiochloris irregularis]|uniref:Uncharacterized protein n=1 Tax=Symbiochloris irregularis TaxID=706552 RepID=A0AAW1P180_9CHLO
MESRMAKELHQLPQLSSGTGIDRSCPQWRLQNGSFVLRPGPNPLSFFFFSGFVVCDHLQHQAAMGLMSKIEGKLHKSKEEKEAKKEEKEAKKEAKAQAKEAKNQEKEAKKHDKEAASEDTRETHPHKKEQQHSMAAQRQHADPNVRAHPQLILENAPKRAGMFGGKGMEGNTTYDIEHAPGHHHGSPSISRPSSAKPGSSPGKASAADMVQNETSENRAGDAPVFSGTAEPGEATHDPVVPKIPDRPGIVIHAAELVEMIMFLTLLGFALFLKWSQPHLGGLTFGLMVGLGLGCASGWLFYLNRGTKQLLNDGLNLTPGQKGLTRLLGHIPSWVTFRDKEKVEWLNTMVNEAWPMYDRAICQMVKETVEPIMEQYKPPGLVKKIYFKTLTFGEAPIKLESVWVEDEGENHVLLEVDFRWAGDANVAICVEVAGNAARMVPRVTNLSVAGTFRVILSPLVPTIPCFGAAVISLRKEPLIHFSLEFAGPGASAVKMWLDPFLRDTLASLLVWPNRIVVPILPESQCGSLDHLKLRHVGLLIVEIIEAVDLHKQDVFGKADPLVSVWTQGTRKETTGYKKHTLHPTWNETKYCLVQEPKTQELHVEMADHDAVNLKDITSSLNVVKNIKESIGKASFMARALVPLRPFHDKPGEPVDEWYELGKNGWHEEDGTGKGCGKIRLKVTYWPFDLLYKQPREAKTGAVLVHLKHATNVVAADPNGLSDPYVILTIGKEQKKSVCMYRTLEPVWEEKYDWTQVPIDEVLKVEMWDEDKFNGDDTLGKVEIDIRDEISTAPNGTAFRRWFLNSVPPDYKTKEVYETELTMEVHIFECRSILGGKVYPAG